MTPDAPDDGGPGSVDPDPDAPATDAQTACFEAGIKFGSLYHQFAGTPVSPASAPSLARAMEEAIENQPFCTGVTVDVDEVAIADAIADGVGYTELTGRFLTVEIDVSYAGVDATARMSMDEGYPRMRLVAVDGD